MQDRSDNIRYFRGIKTKSLEEVLSYRYAWVASLEYLESATISSTKNENLQDQHLESLYK